MLLEGLGNRITLVAVLKIDLMGLRGKGGLLAALAVVLVGLTVIWTKVVVMGLLRSC